MGPLVPDVVTGELNLIVALLVGVAFGFILEQAGFSSPRTLTGLFYGTDFTVLRVFFTAGLTAMTGVVLLAKAGLLDASVIYVNPTFLHSAIVGGLVMGVGFVVGGYCPGTSFCAMAVGRLDALAFAAGGLAGVAAFGEAFPALRGFYEAGSLGDVTLPAYAGIPPGLFLAGMVAVAIAAFVVTGRIERRVNAEAPVRAFDARRHRLAGAAFAAIAVAAALVPDSRTRLLARAGDPQYQAAHPVDRMTADELAFRIVDADPGLAVLDLRPAADVAKASLPGAITITASDLLGRALPPELARPHRRKVFVAEDEREARAAATLASLVGVRNVAVLEGGWSGFRAAILDPPTSGAIAAPHPDTAAFRAEAGRRISALARVQAGAATVVRTPKKIAGGCGV